MRRNIQPQNANNVTKTLYPQNGFSGHLANKHFNGQAQVNVQQPFSENSPLIQQPIRDPQKQIMDLLTSMNQRLINLEKEKV